MYSVRQQSQTPEEVVAQSTLNEQVEKFEKKLVEQQRKDKEQRQSEQIKMQIQLKDFETQLYQQQKRDFEFTQREHQHIQQQVRDYQQKLVCGQQGTSTLVAGGIVTGTQMQIQVRDFERMLVEKQQQEIDRRTRVHFHLQQKLKEFERILCEQQQMEFEHLIRKQEQLRSIGITGQFSGVTGITGITGVNGIICGGLPTGSGVTGGMWAEKQQILDQQTQEEKTLKNKQEKLLKYVKEIESELNNRDLEQTKREVTGHLRTQQVLEKVQNSQLYNQCVEGVTGKYNTIVPLSMTSGKVEQIQMLEQQLCEYKKILALKLREQTPFGVPTTFTTGPFETTGQFGQSCVGGMIKDQIEQVYTIEWIKEIVQKLRELECQLVSTGISCWAEKKLVSLKNHIGFFEQIELPQQSYQCHQQLLKLRDLLDYEMPIEIRPVGPTTQIARQLCHELVRLVEEKIKYRTLSTITGETTGLTGIPVEQLWHKLKTIEYKIRDLRQGEYEPHWSNIYKRMYNLEQVFQQPEFFRFNGCTGIPVTQKMECIQEHIQQLEWLIQETVFVQRQVPFKYQVGKYQQQKQIVRKLVQLIDEIECQMQLQLTVVGGAIPSTPIHYQAQMIIRQLKGLKCQLKCLLHQQNLVVMHHKMQQMVFDYERQLPKEMIENRIHNVQFTSIMQVLKNLEQQLIEQHMNGYQSYQQIPTTFNGVGYLCIEEVFEQIKQQFLCQKQLQQVIRDFATLLVQHKQVIPVQVRMQVHHMLMQQIKDFESLLNQCNEVYVDQEQYFGQFPVAQIPQYFVQQYTTQHKEFQILFKQLQQVLCQVQVPSMGTVSQYVPYQQHSQLVNVLIQQIQQIQMQHQQLINYQQYPSQFLWCIEQQQKPCYRRLQQYLQQLQQLQYLPITDVLPQQQQYILFKQVQQQLQLLSYIHQQYLRSKLWKNWSSWTQTNVPVLGNHLQYLKQQQQQIRILSQQLQDFVQPRIMSQLSYGPSSIRQQMIKSISQPTLIGELPLSEECYETTPYGMDINNNTFSSWCLVEPETTFGDDFIVNFFTGKEVEQEKIVSDLVQRYIEVINVPSEINTEFRRKFEQLYFENNKLGQFLRSKVNDVAQLRKQFEELQITRGFPLNKYGVPTTTSSYRSYRSVTPTTPYGGVMGGSCIVPTTPFGGEYESLPTTSFGEESFTGMPEYYSNKPSLRYVEQMLNTLENKLTNLRFEGSEYPTTESSFYGIRNGLNTIPYGINTFNGIQEPTTIVPTVTIGQQTTLEVTKKQQLPTGQITQTQVYSECKICPVCGIAVEKELSQPEFELHVNSHFPFAE